MLAIIPDAMMDAPTPAELRAFCAGSLPPERFAAVDGWLASVPEAEAEAALVAADVTGPVSGVIVPVPVTGFEPVRGAHRFVAAGDLGTGGMAVVRALRDRQLQRTVALKVLRPRRAEEPLEQYHLREDAFRREAARTAALEHPAIPPVYDLGQEDGVPAFSMRKVEGQTLEVLLAGGGLPLAEGLPILLRVAEAIAFAHDRGVVHRDLTPRNIVVGAYGAVYVLDWGLAASTGNSDGLRAGTPGWMAPEQQQGAAADPRQDVYGLGALAVALITGRGPAGIEHLPGPSGITALIRRCLAVDPGRRYPDAGAVAADLRRWLTEGVTLAQNAATWEIAWVRLRRSSRVRTGLLVGVLALVVGLGLVGWRLRQDRREAEERLHQLETVDLTRPGAIDLALEETRVLVRRYPGLAAAQVLAGRLEQARQSAEAAGRAAAIQARLADMLERTRTHGPWADQVQAWREAIRNAGLTMDPERRSEDVQVLGTSPLQQPLSEALAFLWRAERERGADHHAAATAALLAEGGATPGWRALGRLLSGSRFAAHDPVLEDGADAEAALAEAATTAVVLALFAPSPRLSSAAQAALVSRPGDFWPLMSRARATLEAGDAPGAERLALVAVGAEPRSLLPLLILAYAALQQGDDPAFAEAVARSLVIDAHNHEILVLQAVALARAGHRAEAQQIVDGLDAGHLRFHLRHQVGHPMERGVLALVAAGLVIPEAPAELGPLSPSP